MRALGVDVGVHFLHVAVLDDDLILRVYRSAVPAGEINLLEAGLELNAIAIDSPPAWSQSGKSRAAERRLAALGIQSYATPSDPKDRAKPFYDWMRVGFRVFQSVVRSFPRYAGGPVEGTAIEIFPHASTVALCGCAPAYGSRGEKFVFRRSLLEARGIKVAGLRNLDEVDATLAALTALIALSGECSAIGDPDEGVIVLPTPRLPSVRYGRCVSASGTGAQSDRPSEDRGTGLRLPS